MGDVINFPGLGEVAVRQALEYFRQTYTKAGLSVDQTAAAMEELEPVVRSFLVWREFEFTLPASFTEDEVIVITEAHNKAMREAIQYFSGTLWSALCNIAGLIGRSAQYA